MDLGRLEARLRAALIRALPADVVVAAGPLSWGPATGLRAEVFVHAASVEDLGGVMPDGARVARRATHVGPEARGYAEERPARAVVTVTCVCASLRQAQRLSGLVTPPLLLAAETLPDTVLASTPDGAVTFRFADGVATLRVSETRRDVYESVPICCASLTVHVDGFLHVVVAQPGGLDAVVPSGVPTMRVAFNPPGIDLPREHVVLRNETADDIELGGWTLRDTATRPHRFRFPDVSLAPGAEVRVWTTRGDDDAGNLYWGRRQAVWNNTGDAAVLVDAAGREVARVTWIAPTRRPRTAPVRPATPARKRGKPR